MFWKGRPYFYHFWPVKSTTGMQQETDQSLIEDELVLHKTLFGCGLLVVLLSVEDLSSSLAQYSQCI